MSQFAANHASAVEKNTIIALPVSITLTRFTGARVEPVNYLYR